jgi:hypothetical protein
MNEQPDDDFEAMLWRSAKIEEPSAGARSRALAAAVAAGMAGAAGAAAGGTVPEAAAAAKGLAFGWKLALAALILGGVAAIVVASRTRDAVPAPAPTAASRAIVASSLSAVESSSPSPSNAEPAANAPASAEPTAIASAAPTATATASSPRMPRALTLAEEVLLVDRARAALGRGDTSGALRALDEHDARSSHGALAPEATVLRIEALVAAGERAKAMTTARAFLATHPSSPLAARVRKIVEIE